MSSLTSSPNANDAAGGRTDPQQTTPAEHRRGRKSWTEEEKRSFWQQKKQAKKERKKATAAGRQEALQSAWETLTEEERATRRAEAAEQHEGRRRAEAQLIQRCEAQLADARVPTLVFDLSFAWCMTVPDTKSTVSQVKFSYSSLRRAGFPFRPVITSLLGKEKADAEHDAAQQQEVLQALSNFDGFRRFPPRVTQEEHWSELFSADSVVFLSADAPDVLTTVEPNTAYIIGAFVDHNRYKGLSYAAAQRHCVRSARLPIKESVELGNRCKVLTINHIVDVLIKYEALRTAGTPNWGMAIDEALPIRRTRQEAQQRRKRSRHAVNGASSADEEASGSDTTHSRDE
ncbi:hypothetical protein ABB37_03059 [Leptomonas pyrrhocoris]|uniref:tRNA (guanine(9)-N(1))-methyltransferase n=1 Tax=Leptomonas pyrrhocoris TaxID=157538 RepID=A0A0N0DXV5_LEPPY|nr:hypothetical protein ABB37_03059 [Leptomonas pyrrhocoris]KPA83425.1 hypothetical protein ABB37_03059 [Leptomonas pyrrhocoris]|eukprot:XP_015661864.1 hypothetical protein ABB37_03059 [Leptomonas pyrrhocoris]